MSLYNESQFDSQLSQPLELVNGQTLELCDDYDHKQLKKHNEKL